MNMQGKYKAPLKRQEDIYIYMISLSLKGQIKTEHALSRIYFHLDTELC